MNIPFKQEKANWVKVLIAMYEHQMSTNESYEGFGEALGDFLGKNHVISEETGLTPEEIAESRNYLQEIGLVHENGFGLTSKGFQVAHQRKMERRQWWTNTLLTSFLILLSAISVYPIILS